MTDDADLLRTLRWLDGPQPYATSPSAAMLGESRDRGFARDERGRIVLTGDGIAEMARLEALEAQ